MKRFVIIMSALLASALPLSNVFVTKAMAKDVTVKVGGDIPWEAIILPLHVCSATILPFRTEPIFRRVRQTFPSSTASLSVMAVVA